MRPLYSFWSASFGQSCIRAPYGRGVLTTAQCTFGDLYQRPRVIMTVASFDISVRIEIRVKLRDSSYRTGLVMGSSTFAAAYFGYLGKWSGSPRSDGRVWMRRSMTMFGDRAHTRTSADGLTESTECAPSPFLSPVPVSAGPGNRK